MKQTSQPSVSFRALRWSTETPNDRLVLDGDGQMVNLYAETTAGRGPATELEREVHDKLVLTRQEAVWLHQALGQWKTECKLAWREAKHADE